MGGRYRAVTDERGVPGPGSADRVRIAESQGVQVGDHNVQVSFLLGNGQPAGPVVAGEIPQEPLAFQPREDVLAVLRSGGPGVLVVAAVTGLRGVGKTQAAAFARERADAAWRLVGWVDAQDEASVLAGLAGLAVVAGRHGPRLPAVQVRGQL